MFSSAGGIVMPPRPLLRRQALWDASADAAETLAWLWRYLQTVQRCVPGARVLLLAHLHSHVHSQVP